MATAETVDMGPPHVPKEESIIAFNEIEVDLKRALQHLRHDTNKHEPEFFAAVSDLSDHQLTNFSSKDLVLVRVANSAYGLHLFGKVALPETSGKLCFHFRAWNTGEQHKFHSIHTEEIEEADGNKKFRAIFTQEDPLVWFDA